jgi:hypothetical protein
MPGFLTPTINGTDLTVSIMMQQPPRITERISALAGPMIVLDKMFHTLGTPVVGGAMLFNVVKASDFLAANDVEQRGQGDEYPIIKGVDPHPAIAKPEDWGGKFAISDQQVAGNDQEYLNDQVLQLTNTIVQKLNTRAMFYLEAAIAAMGGSQVISGHNWLSAVTVGPESALTPGNGLPAADLASAQLAGELTRLGTTYDLLLVSPQERYSLRVAYGDKLDAMLASAGLDLFSSPNVAPGTAYVMQRGQVGLVGFVSPLKTETWREPNRRLSWVQAYAEPAFAVNKPQNVVKLTGLAG